MRFVAGVADNALATGKGNTSFGKRGSGRGIRRGLGTAKDENCVSVFGGALAFHYLCFSGLVRFPTVERRGDSLSVRPAGQKNRSTRRWTVYV